MRDPLYLHLGDATSTGLALGWLSASTQTVAGAAPSISVRVYPNPWRADRHEGSPIIFDQWTGTGSSTIKIFTAPATISNANVAGQRRVLGPDQRVGGRRGFRPLYLSHLQ